MCIRDRSSNDPVKNQNCDDHGLLNIINNYPPKWRWIVVDIYRAAKRRGRYPPLFTSTSVNNCFSIYHTRWINSVLMIEKGLFRGGLLRCRLRAARIARGERFFIVKCSVSSSCRQIKLLHALVKLLRSHLVELNSSCCWNQAEKHQMFHCFHGDFSARQLS